MRTDPLNQAQVLFSSTDLVNFLGCRYACLQEILVMQGKKRRPDYAEDRQLIQEAGFEHEKSFLDSLRKAGKQVVEISTRGSFQDRIRDTRQAMLAGTEIIYQAALHEAPWHGFADFLFRAPIPSNLGAHSYFPVDTKLKRIPTAKHFIQLGVYALLLKAVQGTLPKEMRVVAGDGREESLACAEAVYYVRHAQRRIEEFVGSPDFGLGPEPCKHCSICAWKEECDDVWIRQDHLSQVANLRKSQREKLIAAGIDTVEKLATAPDGTSIPRMAEEAFRKIRHQASLQYRRRTTGKAEVMHLPRREGLGFFRMPPPHEGDLFFDMEGDPLFPGGLEYLFGVFHRCGNAQFKAFWGHDRNLEKKAFENIVDFFTAHLEKHPGAHIYHYNHYEITALKRLMGQHRSREDEIDHFLRRGIFVDLYKIVREGIMVSEPGYSLKNLEVFYMPKRVGEVKNAEQSIVVYEAWRRTRGPALLKEIEDYNRIDCESTASCRDWLLGLRPADIPWFAPAPLEDTSPTTGRMCPKSQDEPQDAAVSGQGHGWPVLGPTGDVLEGTPSEQAREAQNERIKLREALTEEVCGDGGLGADREGAAGPGWAGKSPHSRVKDLLLSLCDFHRREQKPQWWKIFDLANATVSELMEDLECVGGLTLEGLPTPEKNSLIFRYRFPPQETKRRAGERPLQSDTLRTPGTIVAIDPVSGSLAIKRGKKLGDPTPTLSLLPPQPVPDQILRKAIERVAGSCAAGDDRFPALKAFLGHQLPSTISGCPPLPLGKPDLESITKTVLALENQVLFIQGPPGCGKTHYSGRVILNLLKEGKRVGVSSNSHKAIINLLRSVEKAAGEDGWAFRGAKKSDKDDPEKQFGGRFVRDVFKREEIGAEDALVAGTAWLFADPGFEAAFDFLFVDEAGQVSLANLTAMGTAARNIILVGDQMQLGQPIQGLHPGESGASALEFLLQGKATVPPETGIFLGTTWRLHSSICGFISEAVYDGRLQSHPDNDSQVLELNAEAHPALKRHGIVFLPAEHTGCAQKSEVEGRIILDLFQNLLKQNYVDRRGIKHPISPSNILVIAPYNLQTNHLKSLLPEGARVGTVDKFQGQEAEVVLISMTTSDVEELPRDIEFLFSRHRLNVAVSRARSLAVVVASPGLLEIPCETTEQLALVNTLCRLKVWSDDKA